MQLINKSFELSNDDAKDCFIHNKATYKIVQKLGSTPNLFIIVDPIDEKQKIMKICKVASRFDRNNLVKRFEREIDALIMAKEAHIDRVIEVFFDGSMSIGFEF